MSYAEAKHIQKRAFARYSQFRVGAYLETNRAGVHAGNVESGSSSNSICAERLVVAQSLLMGETPVHLHLVTDNAEPTPPCGTCLHFMSEWPQMKISMYSFDGKQVVTKTLDELLPFRYTRKL